jgi:hypothetical protein
MLLTYSLADVAASPAAFTCSALNSVFRIMFLLIRNRGINHGKVINRLKPTLQGSIYVCSRDSAPNAKFTVI